MTFPCLHCGESDAHTNAGALFCHDCHDELDDTAKDQACERHLGKERGVA